jgi:hypothetical protein
MNFNIILITTVHKNTVHTRVLMQYKLLRMLHLLLRSDTSQCTYSHMYTCAANYRWNVGGTWVCTENDEQNMSDLCLQLCRNRAECLLVNDGSRLMVSFKQKRFCRFKKIFSVQEMEMTLLNFCYFLIPGIITSNTKKYCCICIII